MPVILLVGNKKDKSQEREVEKFDAESVRMQVYNRGNLFYYHIGDMIAVNTGCS